MAEPKNLTPAKLRDWRMFQIAFKGKHRPKFDGRRPPKISELLVSHMQGAPSEKLEWLKKQKAAGTLAGDDPDEIAEAEALLQMLARLAATKARKERKQHLDELLDDGLKGTFPASDPVSVGHFTSTEFDSAGNSPRRSNP
jgi:hypothetical protein